MIGYISKPCPIKGLILSICIVLAENIIMKQLNSISVPSKLEPNFLFVALHGWGANCNDLTPFVAELNLPNYGFEFPDAPLPHPEVPGGKMWSCWLYEWFVRGQTGVTLTSLMSNMSLWPP